ncbi:phosphoesterase [Halobacteriales archaeon QH_2_65_14]|nr:MAG: phosphoesterase [Halobacteriales archaeon QH_2_65_14]
MYSLNVPVPGRVAALASDIARDLPEATPRTRGEHTLGVKRLVDGRNPSYDHLEAEVRELLAGQPAFDISVTSVEYFADAPRGTSPVVYLAVESPGLVRLHRDLAAAFDPVEDIEGEEYVPHVTIARGGSVEMARRAAERDVEPVTWTASELVFWDARYSQPVSTVSLPA